MDRRVEPKPVEYDSSSLGAYAMLNGAPHAGEVALEINDGEISIVVYLTPEEAFRLSDELTIEGAQALYISESRKAKKAS